MNPNPQFGLSRIRIHFSMISYKNKVNKTTILLESAIQESVDLSAILTVYSQEYEVI